MVLFFCATKIVVSFMREIYIKGGTDMILINYGCDFYGYKDEGWMKCCPSCGSNYCTGSLCCGPAGR